MSGRRSSLDHAMEQASSMTAWPATTRRATVRSRAVALAAKYAAMSSWRLGTTTVPALREAVADAHDRGGVAARHALGGTWGHPPGQPPAAEHTPPRDKTAA